MNAPLSTGSTARAPLRSLASFRGLHAGERIIVCGCGASLAELTPPVGAVTIGVNDVGRHLDPDYLVVVNPRNQFAGDRFKYVESSRARYLFTQLDLQVAHPAVIKFRLGRHGGTDFTDPDMLHFTQNSPYVALCLAVHMGAKRIGLIGVDFTEHHFFARTGVHPLTRQLAAIDQQYGRLNEALARLGVEVVNLSPASRLTAFPRMSITAFLSAGAPEPAADTAALRIVSYATTPVAGVPSVLARCITARTPHRARCVWARSGYGNGVDFAGDIEWAKRPAEAEAALREADIVIVHNGKVEPRHRALMSGKAIVTMAHNYMWNVDPTFVQQGFPGIVVGQYQATLREFAGWTAVPSPMPLWEPAFQPGRKSDRVCIAYTPSGKHEAYPQGHRLYWHGKGYSSTMRALDRLAARHGVEVFAVRDRQLSHAEALTGKQRAHIVIDECVTGSYHRNSLEGLALGCVVVNGVGLLAGVTDVLRRCAPEAGSVPFVHATRASLESVLVGLIEQGAAALAADGQRNRDWMEHHWEFGAQWQRYWQPAIERARAQARLTHRSLVPAAVMPPVVVPPDPAPPRPVPARPAQRADDARPAAGVRPGVSVVIPHGGEERLPHLAFSLADLSQCAGVDEIIVVDMGPVPVAARLARRWGAKYVFVKNDDVFERARSLNVGSALAERELILWKDNDLVVPTGFVVNAAAELRARGADYLVPYASIDYLSQADTQAVMAGERDPARCRPARTLLSGRHVSGGAGLVTRQFLLRHGGMLEAFRGWGGEDNAWIHKVTLFGRYAITDRREQRLYHLFHSGSGAHEAAPQRQNPYYQSNVALLYEIRAIRQRERFVERFGAAPIARCPWPPDRRISLVVERNEGALHAQAGLMAAGLRELHAIDPGLIVAAPDRLVDIAERSADAVILVGASLAAAAFADNARAQLRARTVAVLETLEPFADAGVAALRQAAAVAVTDDAIGRALALRAGITTFTLPSDAGALAAGIAVVQPLSLALGGGAPPSEDDQPRREETNAMGHAVWLYWEGDCPDWIKACQRTIAEHASDVRLLNRASFDALWDRDRDIDIERLQPAHRADFVRAFLLARYGGLWIDSDCIAMKPLQPLLDLLARHDFIAHRDRQGFYPNGFIGAATDSRIAQAFYQKVCRVLRSGKPIGWIGLGGQPLTELLKTTDVPWHELACELIQPVCWSRPEVFFAVANDAEHARALDPGAYCYMLSNTEIRKHQAAHPRQSLTADGTFFRYLLKQSLTAPAVAAAPPTAPLSEHIPFFLSAAARIAPRRVLEVGVGRGTWGMLLRDLVEQDATTEGVSRGLHLAGINLSPGDATACHAALYDELCVADAADPLAQEDREWDLILIAGALDARPPEVARTLVDKALRLAPYVLAWGRVDAEHRCNGDRPLRWSRRDYLALGSVQASWFAPGELGAFLLSRSDPRQVAAASPMVRVFEQVLQERRKVADESVSGPGSCLAQTLELRRALPHLLQSLEARSLLDAPCGDFNWMKHVALGLDDYIGADILHDLLLENGRKYAAKGRRFVKLDVTCDELPAVDVVLCRDCLVHFSYEDMWRAVGNFMRSGSTYLLTTTFPKLSTNADIATGDWRPVNLQLPPFRFPAPLRLLVEGCTEAGGRYADKSLGLWRLRDLA